ncbi:MAG: hypothetical protein K9H25_19585 [Rhodospirillum sp.]|nr:hypothetical protein [Rhodospirillum sp.]MCF8491282.1 hypothetical protein [Rhodospirillum sp.]MCF8501002.1 hypothetical protein [Rhodospirillum sp.]
MWALFGQTSRLGNLFKLALDQVLEVALKTHLLVLADRIADTQSELKAAAVDLRQCLQPTRRR